MAAPLPLASIAVPLAAAAAVALACNLSDPAVAESSGAARAAAPAWFYTHNDSGDRARFFAVDRSCRTVGTWRVRNATAVDWEDMAAGPDATLWFGDIGDNRARRDHVSLYRVDASALPAGGGTVAATRIDLRYEDGPHDAETLLVHPVDGRIWVVTKSAGGEAGVYEARDGVLHRVAALDLDLGGATGGDIAPDGRKVVVRTYVAAYEWAVTGGDVAAAFAGPPVATATLPYTEQGEAIAYVDDGRALVTTAEGVGAAVRTFPSAIGDLPASSVPTRTATEPAGDGDGGDPPWPALLAAGAAIVAATAALVARARRRGE